MTTRVARIIVCRCANRQDVIPPHTRGALENGLRECGVLLVDELCALAAEKAPLLAEFAAQAGAVVVACQARAVRALFVAAGSPLAQDAQIHNARTGEAGDIIAQIGPLAPGASVSVSAADPWQPWFPVIDRARCTNCKQCLNFCLFGTYSLNSSGEVVVSQPRACKNNCPACARICPSVAIIFPKYIDSPINGGEISDEESERERVKVDTQAILGSDVYAALRARQDKRRRLLSEEARQEQEQKALLERESWRQMTQEEG